MDGFRIRGEFYPFNGRIRPGDPTIIREITGLAWKDFVALAGDTDELEDPTLVDGFVAIAISRKHPDWSTRLIHRFLRTLDYDDLAPPEQDVEGSNGAGPPAGQPGPNTQPGSTQPSRSGSAPTQPTSTPQNSGTLESVTGSPV